MVMAQSTPLVTLGKNVHTYVHMYIGTKFVFLFLSIFSVQYNVIELIISHFVTLSVSQF